MPSASMLALSGTIARQNKPASNGATGSAIATGVASLASAYMQKRGNDAATRERARATEAALRYEREQQAEARRRYDANEATYQRELDAYYRTYFPEYAANRPAGGGAPGPAAGGEPRRAQVAAGGGARSRPLAQPEASAFLPAAEPPLTLGTMLSGEPAQGPVRLDEGSFHAGSAPARQPSTSPGTLAQLPDFDWRRYAVNGTGRSRSGV